MLLKLDPIQTAADTNATLAQYQAAVSDSQAQQFQIMNAEAGLARDEASLRSARADLEQAQSNFTRAQSSFKRKQQLHEDGLISRDEYEIAQNDLKVYKDRIAYTEQFAENAAKLTALGIVLLFVVAMIVLQTIDRALNQIWRVPRPRTTVQRVFIYWALLTVGPMLIGASLSLTSWLVSQSLGAVKDVPLAGQHRA